MIWLDEIEEVDKEFREEILGQTHLSNEETDRERMARVIREFQVVIQAANELIEIVQSHWTDYGITETNYDLIRLEVSTKYWSLIDSLSDDAKGLLG